MVWFDDGSQSIRLVGKGGSIKKSMASTIPMQKATWDIRVWNMCHDIVEKNHWAFDNIGSCLAQGVLHCSSGIAHHDTIPYSKTEKLSKNARDRFSAGSCTYVQRVKVLSVIVMCIWIRFNRTWTMYVYVLWIRGSYIYSIVLYQQADWRHNKHNCLPTVAIIQYSTEQYYTSKTGFHVRIFFSALQPASLSNYCKVCRKKYCESRWSIYSTPFSQSDKHIRKDILTIIGQCLTVSLNWQSINMNVALPFRSEPALRRTIDHSLIPPRETNNSGTIAENVTTTASSSITSPEDNIGLTVNCLKLDRLSLHNEMPCVIPTEQEDFLPNQDRLLISVKKFERLTVSSNADKKSRYNEDFDITECNSITEEECSTVSSHEDTSDTELLWQAAIRNPDEKQRLALYWTLCYPDIADNHSTTQSREHIHNDTLDRKKSW